MHPLVSVVIPCYNAENDIGEAIQSALDQTYPNVEVIVIDDGSTDGSLEVIRSFDERIRWETGPNRGAPAARNRGVELARGEIVQFLDADDLLHPDKLERQVEAALLNRPVLTFCRCNTILKEGSKVVSGARFNDEDSVVTALLNVILTSAPLHWKDQLVSIGGFREDLPCAQEWDLHLRLACGGVAFAVLPECLYTVRCREGGLGSNKLQQVNQRSRIMWDAYRYLEKVGQLTPRRLEAFASAMANEGRKCLRYGKKVEARRCFEDARKMDPSGDLGGAYPSHPRIGGFLLRVLGPVLTERVSTLYITFRDSLRRLKRSMCKAIGK